MNRPAWHLEQHTARLQLGGWKAAVHLAEPHRGLTDWRAGPGVALEASVLGIQIPAFAASPPESAPDGYCRGAALTVAYPEAGGWPVRVEASWRALLPAPSASAASAAIDLVVSVRTELPESQLRLTVQSRLPAVEVLRLVDAARGRFERCGPADGLPPAGEPAGGAAGCWLFRLPGAETSYAEMVHPADFQGSELSFGGERERTVGARHRLFVEHLEKGVMLRARVRGALLPRRNDARLAASAYAAFASADPPLGS